MIRISYLVVCICLLCMTGALGAVPSAGEALTAPTLSPDRIEMGTFYNGATVQVSANVPACDGAVLVLRIDGEPVRLNRKGQVAGIWLNVAQVTVEGAPRMYVLVSSDSLNEICAPEVQKELHLGIENLGEQMHFVSDKPLSGSEFEDFLTLKDDNSAYRSELGADLTAAEPGRMKLSAELPIAPTTPPGTYNIMLYCFRDGQPIGRATAGLTLERVGFARLMANLAHDHSAGYGVLAVAVAMVVGLLMGVVFDSLPGSGH